MKLPSQLEWALSDGGWNTAVIRSLTVTSEVTIWIVYEEDVDGKRSNPEFFTDERSALRRAREIVPIPDSGVTE